MAEQDKTFGLEPDDYNRARKRLIEEGLQDRKAKRKISPVRDHILSILAEKGSVVKLENIDPISYMLFIDMMHVLNQMDDASGNTELINDLKTKMNECGLSQLEEFISIMPKGFNENTGDKIQQGITSYLTLRSRLDEHLKTKKDSNGR